MAFGEKVEFDLQPSYFIRDLRGRMFGRLAVVGYKGKNNNRHWWRCVCECGNEVSAYTEILTSNKKKSCGCLQQESRRNNGGKNCVDYTGKKYGYLVAVKDTGKRTVNYTSIWLWKCSLCNTEFEQAITGITRGKVSCGCMLKDAQRANGKALWRSRATGETMVEARANVEMEMEMEKMHIESALEKGAHLNWTSDISKLPAPEVKPAIIIEPDFDWWKDNGKLKPA